MTGALLLSLHAPYLLYGCMRCLCRGVFVRESRVGRPKGEKVHSPVLAPLSLIRPRVSPTLGKAVVGLLQ